MKTKIPSLRGGDWGLNVAPSYVHRKTEEKYNQTESLAVLTPSPLLVAFTLQLEILVTSLDGPGGGIITENCEVERNKQGMT